MSDSPGTVTPRTHRTRLRIVVVGFFVATLAYVLRAGFLQLVQGDHWRKLAAAQNAEQVELPAARGGFYDRTGKPLVLDGDEFRAYLAPSELDDPVAAVTAVDRILGLSASEEKSLRSARSGWVAIPRRVTGAERDQLMAAVRQGIHFERLSTRVFPDGHMARALLGTLSPDGHGRSGLELALDSVLRGRPGARLTRRDAHGQLYRLPDAQIRDPRPGYDVVLTLDAQLQAIAEAALQKALQQTGASGGDIVILDPDTGELLAVASQRGDDRLAVPAFADPYEPGSTLKPFLLASLLQEGKASLADKVYAEHGVWRHGGRTIRDVHGYDTLTVAQVVQHSSNIGAAKLSARLQPGQQYRFLRDFGFGAPTGIEYPAESPGTLRKPDDWSGFSQASLAMGYEISVTSLQLVSAYAALANGGVLMRPYLVKEIRDPKGNVVWRRDPMPLRRVIRPDVAAKVTKVLASVVEDGTGVRAALANLPVAGKTGTARMASDGSYRDRKYAASFVGFCPVDDPRMVILTKLEDPQGSYYGGSTAAPISRATLQAALATRGITLTSGQGAAGGDDSRFTWGPGDGGRSPGGPYVFAVSSRRDDWKSPGEDRASSSVLPDVRGLSVRGAIARLHDLGLRVKLEGRGEVRSQSPGPGARVTAGATVVLQ